jgi:hypothetical protein
MNTTDIETLAPEPDPSARDPQAEMQQAAIAQQMAEMEIAKENSNLRAQENEMKRMRLQLDQQKQAMQAAKDMGELGLKNDEMEAKIQRQYVQSLKDMVDMGYTKEEAISGIIDVEDTFIGDNPVEQPPIDIAPQPEPLLAEPIAQPEMTPPQPEQLPPQEMIP